MTQRETGRGPREQDDAMAEMGAAMNVRPQDVTTSCHILRCCRKRMRVRASEKKDVREVKEVRFDHVSRSNGREPQDMPERVPELIARREGGGAQEKRLPESDKRDQD